MTALRITSVFLLNLKNSYDCPIGRGRDMDVGNRRADVGHPILPPVKGVLIGSDQFAKEEVFWRLVFGLRTPFWSIKSSF